MPATMLGRLREPRQRPFRPARLDSRNRLTDGLLAFYDFRQRGQGITIPNQVGPAYAGVLEQPTDSTSGWVPTFEGAAWYVGPFVSGNPSLMRVGSAPIPALPTYAAWVILPATIPTNGLGIFGTTNSTSQYDSTHDRDLAVETGGTVRGYVFDGAPKEAVSTNTVSARQRCLFVMTVDGTNLNVYVNGQLWAQTAATGAYTGYSAPNWFLGSGWDGNASGPYVPGDFYLLSGAIWNRPLSAGEVLQFYLKPWSLFVPPIVERSVNVAAAPAGGASGSLSLLGVGS